MTAPTATRRTSKTRPQPTRSRRQARLPRLGWWWAAIAIGVISVANTWPVYSIVAAVLAAATAITVVVRPRFLAPLINQVARISARRPALAARGHRSLAYFARMRPDRFEQAIAELASEDQRVVHAQAVGQANDRGADVLVSLNDGRRILIQCKHHELGNNVGSPVIQTINGVYRDIHSCHQAVIVTTAAFTRSALETNAMLPHPIRLVDGAALVAWANGGPTPW